MQTEKEKEVKIMSHLSPRLASYWRREIKSFPDEIRLTLDMPLITLTGEKAVMHDIDIKFDDLSFVLRSLCASSMYAHSDTICDGYVTTADGIRAGIVGRATVKDGRITSVTCVSSIVIRVPRRFPGASHELCRFLINEGFSKSVIICAPPSGGKTTALRELSAEISQAPYLIPTALVDTRCEMASKLQKSTLCTLSAYPRPKGVEIAVRTLSPRLVITDEASNDDDIDALLYALSSGVAFAASAHGTSESVRRTELYRRLSMYGSVALCDVEKKNGRFRFIFEED